MQFTELSPAALGIKDKNLKAAANTEYASGVIHRTEGNGRLVVFCSVTASGGTPTVGDARVLIQPVDYLDANLGPQIELAELIDSQTSTECVVAIGGGKVATIKGGTLHVEAELVRILGRFKLILEVQVASDATTATGSLTAWLE